MIFRNISEPNKEFTIEEVIAKLLAFIKEDSNYTYRIIVGTDSLHRTKKTSFSTAVIIHRVGRCAKFFYTRYFIEKYPRAIVTRIMKEVKDSVEIVMRLQDSELIDYVDSGDWELHIDAGEKGESIKVVHQALSYVKAMGLNGLAKPDAAIATNVADKYTGQ